MKVFHDGKIYPIPEKPWARVYVCGTTAALNRLTVVPFTLNIGYESTKLLGGKFQQRDERLSTANENP